MKKSLLVAVIMFVSATLGQAQTFKAGVHGGYTIGGDVEDKGFAYGAQAEMKINDLLSVELAGTGFTDSDSGADLKVRSIGITGICGMKLCEKSRVYVGAGVNYNMFEGSVSPESLLEAELGVGIDEIAASEGMTADEFSSALDAIGSSASFDVDDQIGFHLCAGVTMSLTDTIELFGEYRYTFSKVKGDLSFKIPGAIDTEGPIDDDYNFGVAKIGVNFLF